MNKIVSIIGIGVVIVLGWLFAKPNFPFGVVTPTPIIVSNQPTYFAELDSNGIVLRVIVISQENINTGKWGDPKNWVETTIDGSKRKNYASKGYNYDKTKDSFVAPKPQADAILDELTAKWIVPISTLSPTASK